MASSINRQSGTISIQALAISSITPTVANIHNVTFDLLFNANMASRKNDVVVKIKDLATGKEEDISSTLSFTAPSTLGYTFTYSTSNTNIEILKPKVPSTEDSTIKHQIIVELDGNVFPALDIDVDSCRKYFENSGDLGGQPAAFNLSLYDFNAPMSFNLYSYFVDNTDTLNMYCKGLTTKKGIKETPLDTLNATLTGSTPVHTYDIASNIGGLTIVPYNLDTTDAITIEIEKPTFTENNTFNITNINASQDLNVYMDTDFDSNPITFSSSGSSETYLVQYRMFNPVWKDITFSDNVTPTITVSGEISGGIVSATSTRISNAIPGEITIDLTYRITNDFNNTFTPPKSNSIGAINTYTGTITVSVESFSMTSNQLEWTSTVTQP
jgi:hypothetical protein